MLPAKQSLAKFTPWDLYHYQVRGVRHGLYHPQSMYWLDMGLGKTVIALSVVFERLARGEITSAIVMAPKRVCETVWAQEARKWTHTEDMTFSVILGDPAQRARAALKPANVYLVNYENLNWLVDFLIDHRLSKGLYLPFNMGIYDEVPLLKDWSTKRHEAVRKILPYMPYRMGLTGTPATNGYLDLFGQYLAVDAGARLDHRITYYRDNYFEQSYGGYGYDLKEYAKDQIHALIADITLEMNADDYLTLPEVIYNNIPVRLPNKAMSQYRHLETHLFTELDNGVVIDAANAAVLTGKCLQAANGALYDEEHNWNKLHDVKLEALEDIYEESAGQPLLVFYNFISDHERIKKHFKDAVSFYDYKDTNELVKDWTEGKIRMLIGHPKSAGHGIDGLQYGGHIIVWFGLPWSLDQYLQANARIIGGNRRLVHTTTPIIHHILAEDTMDYAVADALQYKELTQAELRTAIKNYRLRSTA